MKDWYEREQIYCIHCGHNWILISSKHITDEEYNNWYNKVLQQHAQIIHKKGKED